MRLNYHHLRYFREVAATGHLGQAADRLNVAQSALSAQIRQLEDSLGLALFERVSRRLVLTEAGRIALDHAERIFSAGDELLATLSQSGTGRTPLRVGAVSTLSRNFQLQFLRPLLTGTAWDFELSSGSLDTLLSELESLKLDVVLSTQVPASEGNLRFSAQRIAEQPVQLHGTPAHLGHDTLANMLRAEPIILPTERIIQSGFESLAARLGVAPRVVARVDDMAMVRLLARDGVGLAVAPLVVVADEIRSGVLASAPFDLGIHEPFFAVTLPRRFPHPALDDLLRKQDRL